MRHPASSGSPEPTEPPEPAPWPAWHVVLRGLRQVAGITQEGWAAQLGYGRRTVQRWEQGRQAPDARAAVEILALCGRLHLLRSCRSGSLAGLTLDADRLEALLADARLAHGRPGGGVEAPDERADPRQPPGMSKPAGNLPAQITPLVGRDWEVEELRRLVEADRLVTLTGIGGVGKSRLALHVAHLALPGFGDGTWLAELADVTDPSLVPLAVAHALELREIPGRSPFELLIQALRGKQLLLVLDNCEQVRDTVAGLVDQLIRSCPELRVLATSRERLDVAGEVTWPLAPLIVPPAEDGTVDRIARSDAVRLFIERATRCNPGFRLTATNAGDVARVCRRLDGLPLAIELAAAQVSFLTPAELDTQLGARFELLVGTAASVPARHRTLAAALDGSWARLTPSEQELFARLGVFPDGCGLAAISAVCATDDPLPGLRRLVDLALVNARPDAAGRTTRYRLLETVRGYALDRLEGLGATAEAEARLASWCLTMATRAGEAIHGPEQGDWFRWIETEHGTIRSVMQRSLDRRAADTAIDLIVALWWAWGALGRATEARAWADRTLAITAGSSPKPGHAVVQLAAGAYAAFGGSPAEARVRLDEAERLARERGDGSTLLLVLGQRARLLQVSGRFDEAARLAEEGLDPADTRAAADTRTHRWVRARLLEIRAHAALRADRPDDARDALHEALGIARRDGDAWGTATVLAELGDLDRAEGRLREAKDRYEEGLALREGLGIPGATPSLQQNLGFVAGDARGTAECVIGLAGVALDEDAPARAARMLGWAARTLESVGAEVWPSNRADHDRIVAAARAALGDGRWNAERARGASLPLDEILPLAAERVG
jgi:predicted ATPase/transcriptional regulator with XRE-family HTH domain